MASASRTAEIFLICCLEGDLNVVSRILKKNRRSWPGLMARGGGGFDINCRDASNRSGLILATISCWTQIVDLLLSRCIKMTRFTEGVLTNKHLTISDQIWM